MNAALAVLQQEFPAHEIWTEQVRDRTRYVARASVWGANPHTVITSDPGELHRALQDGAMLTPTPGPTAPGHAPGRTDQEGDQDTPDHHSEPVPADLTGRITRISVTYSINTGDGVRHTFHSLQAITKHAPADRVHALTETLTELCEEVLAGRGHSVFGLHQGAIREPFAPVALAR